jgi:hypothetical protein
MFVLVLAPQALKMADVYVYSLIINLGEEVCLGLGY